MLDNAESIGCRKYLTPTSLLSGNPRLNLAFVANLFNTWPGLAPPDEERQRARFGARHALFFVRLYFFCFAHAAGSGGVRGVRGPEGVGAGDATVVSVSVGVCMGEGASRGVA